MIDLKEFPTIVGLMDAGVQKEIDSDNEKWNTRTNLERYPLSPSQIGKCSLALARNLSHYTANADYPRNAGGITPRVQRVFARGHLLEDAIIGDIEKYTPFKVVDRQKKLTVFTLADGTEITGSIDGIAVSPKGTRILIDVKSKGSYYSAGFQDSISQFFTELRQTGHVEALSETSFHITDPKALFDDLSLDEFFVDYLLQLNAYGTAEAVDFVSLYYENKNTCANYEVRWKPVKELYDFALAKFQYVYDNRTTPEAVPKEFGLGSSRCRLCEYNELCWGKYEPKNRGKTVAALPEDLDIELTESVIHNIAFQKTQEQVLEFMMKEELSHVTTSKGLTYERKFLKSPKPHYELRLSK